MSAYCREQPRSFILKNQYLHFLGVLQGVVHAAIMIDNEDLFIRSKSVISFFLWVQMKNKLESPITFHYQDFKVLYVCSCWLLELLLLKRYLLVTGLQLETFQLLLFQALLVITTMHYYIITWPFIISYARYFCNEIWCWNRNRGWYKQLSFKIILFLVVHVSDPSGMCCIIYLSCQILGEICAFIQFLLGIGAYISHFKRYFFQIPKNNF